MAITMDESESATVRQPSVLVKLNIPLLEPADPPSLSPREAASAEVRFELRALARRMPVPISPGFGPLPLVVTFVPPAVVVLEPEAPEPPEPEPEEPAGVEPGAASVGAEEPEPLLL